MKNLFIFTGIAFLIAIFTTVTNFAQIGSENLSLFNNDEMEKLSIDEMKGLKGECIYPGTCNNITCYLYYYCEYSCTSLGCFNDFSCECSGCAQTVCKVYASGLLVKANGQDALACALYVYFNPRACDLHAWSGVILCNCKWCG